MKRKSAGSPEPSVKPAKMAKTMVEKEKKYDRQLRYALKYFKELLCGF